ncbi:MAG TPA: zf-HC2 domain-containing protein [Capsulimonadaceae bacterium]|nr:zf-HC2 domain-containing protein [Capsulimonadaceae bacterium]
MRLHKIDPNNLKPCFHMRTLVSAWVDGKLTGIAKWYTEWHIKHCPQCQCSLPFLRGLHDRLQSLATQPRGEDEAESQLSEPRWSHIEEGWDKVDAGGEAGG